MSWYNTTYDEIYHHGIDGQRWGVQNGPPYPLKPAVSSAVKQGKSREEIQAAKRRSKTLKKARAVRAKNLKEKAKVKAQEEKEKEKSERDAKKQEEKRLKQTESAKKNPSSAFKNRELLTTDELKELADRFAAENRIQELSAARINKGREMANNLLNLAEGGIRGYNMVARIYNTFTDNKSVELPYISGANTGESKNSKGKGNNKGKDSK